MDISVQQVEVKNDINKEGLKKVNDRLVNIKDTEEILKLIFDEIRGVQHKLDNRITESSQKTENKLNKII